MTSSTAQEVRRIVVGVDGSACSKAALKWALTQARLVDATIEAVSAWQDPAVNAYAFGLMSTPYPSENFTAITQTALDEAVAEVRTGLDQAVVVVTRVEEGHPAQVLTKRAAGALMLVVGSRGHGAFAGMLLGSVSQYCVQHMTGPVVVIPLIESPASR